MKRSFRPVVVLAAVVAVTAVLGGCSGGCPPPNPTPAQSPTPTVVPGGDDDRPPIIVSGGSVHLRAVSKNRGNGTNKERGEWKQDGTLWYHDHSYLQPAKHLLVNVIYGGPATDAQCADPEYDFDVRELTVNYGSGKSFKIFIDAKNQNAAGRLATDAPAQKDARIPFWLVVGEDGDSPTSVTFGSLNKTCTLEGGKGQLHIYQRIQ